MKLTKTHWILIILIAIVAICLWIKNNRAANKKISGENSSYRKNPSPVVDSSIWDSRKEVSARQRKVAGVSKC